MQPTDPPPLSAATDEPQTPQAPNAPHAPQAPQPPSKADLFYRVDSSRASFRELWRDARSPAVLVAWLSKLFRVKLPGSVNDPNVTSLRPFEVDESALPGNVRERFGWVVEELTRLGFTPVAYHAIDDHLHTSRLFLANLAHADGRAVARIHLRMEGSSQPPKTHFFWDFVSGVRDGTFVWSSSARALLEPPPQCRQIWRHRAGPAPLWDAHREALRQVPGGENSIVSARSRDEVLDLVARHHAAVSAFHLRRGLFAPLTADERARAAGLESAVASASAAAAPGADPVSADDAKVMYELQQLQAKKSNWVTGGLILLVSLLLFVGAGSWQFSWDFVAMIVVILFFHELGHYVAMRVFRYRNVRMFFIPFFGAAVTGQNFSAPGWKKVVVSLMGPLPGILVGVVLGGVGLLVGNALLLKVAVMTLILNAFNLLPVLPLDGGWVMHALLFSRHHLLDAVFRVGAAAALLLGGYALGDTLLTVLGVVMALGIPSAYKLARATTELRRAAAVPPAAPGEQTVPVDAARTIIATLRSAFPKGMPAKVLATHVLGVYQTLNARPPGVGASIGFGALHAASFVVALVAVAMFTLGPTGRFPRFGRFGGPPALKHTLPTDDGKLAIRRASTAPAPDPAAPHATLVATFDKPPEARQAFLELRQQMDNAGQPASLVLFGQSVFVALPAADDAPRRAWLERLESRTKDVFVLAPPQHVSLSISATAPDEATAANIERELEHYLYVTFTERLIPPWLPDDDRTPGERAAHDKARRTYQQLLEHENDDDEPPELTELSERIQTAVRRGETEEYRRLSEQYQRIQNDATRRRVERLRDAPRADVDGRVIELFLESLRRKAELVATTSPSTTQYVESVEREADAYARLMGRLAGPDAPAGGLRRFGVHGGSVARTGRKLRVSVLPSSLADGAPAIVDWLAARGCADFRYQVSRGFSSDDL